MLMWIALALAVLALLLALAARKAAQAAEDKVVTLRAEVGSAKQETEEALKKVSQQTRFLEALARGDEVDRLMIREGRLYQNIDGKELQRRVEDAGAYVIDVRTPQEWNTGHIAGAVHIPVDEVEARLHEIKRDGTAMHFVCAGGGRSAAAAEIVANRGYRNVFNVNGGMQGYRGEVVRD